VCTIIFAGAAGTALVGVPPYTHRLASGRLIMRLAVRGRIREGVSGPHVAG
jgi:hypothetical protein